MTRWYSTSCYIFIFGAVIFLNDLPSTFTLTKDQDQHRIEHALHDFMKNKKVKTSMENVAEWGRRLVGKFSICGLKTRQKVNLCKRAMVDEDEFVEPLKIEKCKTRTFQFTIKFDDVKKDPQIEMYQCPELKRRNPQDGWVKDSRVLFISRMSSDIKQAMVYIREHTRAAITAARHLTGITKHDLNNEPPPPPPNEIRSRNRPFITTPVQSPAASPFRPSSRFSTAPNSPSQLAPYSPDQFASNSPGRFSTTEISALNSPVYTSDSDISTRKSVFSGITPSMFLGPMVQVPPNVNTGRGRGGRTSTTPTPTGSPLSHRSTPRSTSNTPAYLTPGQLSPLYSASEVGSTTPTRRRRSIPTGIFLNDPSSPSRRSSASTSVESSEDRSVTTDLVSRGVLRPSRFASDTSTGDDSSRGRRTAAADVGRRAGNISTDETRAPDTRPKAQGWEAASGRPNQQTGPKKTQRHKSFKNDRGTHSEFNSLPNEEFDFKGFNTPFPERASLEEMLGTSPDSSSTIHRTHSDNVLGTHDSAVSYPVWQKDKQWYLERHDKSNKKDSQGDSSAITFEPPVQPRKPRDIQTEFRQFKERMKQRRPRIPTGNTGDTFATEEENKAKEDISKAPSKSPLTNVNLFSAYGRNIDRHHAEGPTVLSPRSSRRSLKQLFKQGYSEESDEKLADTSASESLPATFAAQTDLLEKNDSSIETDFSGETNMSTEEENTSGSILTRTAATMESFGGKNEEGTTVLSQSNISGGASVSIKNDESVQAAPSHQLATKDPSVQGNPPPKRSVGTQVDLHKLESTAPSTSADLPLQTDVFPESTNLIPQTGRNIGEVDELGERRDVNLPRAGTDTFTEGSRPSGEIPWSRSRSPTPRQSPTRKVKELEKDTTAPPAKSVRRRFRSPTPSGESGESGDTSTGGQERQITLSQKNESVSTVQKNEDQPPSKEIDTTQSSVAPPSQQPESSPSPLDSSKKKES